MRRRPGAGLMIHSDRGVQYASYDFKAVLRSHNFIQSMSPGKRRLREGNCYDNAVAESFFRTIKTQLIHHCTFRNVNEAQQTIFEYIEVYYNRQRKHSTNNYKSPVDYELEWWYDRKAASVFTREGHYKSLHKYKPNGMVLDLLNIHSTKLFL